MENKYIDINPDCMDLAELKELGKGINLINLYIQIKIRAMENRLNGQIIAAKLGEQQLDKLYLDLPECVKSW